MNHKAKWQVHTEKRKMNLIETKQFIAEYTNRNDI